MLGLAASSVLQSPPSVKTGTATACFFRQSQTEDSEHTVTDRRTTEQHSRPQR
jgi:hypothetical protein